MRRIEGIIRAHCSAGRLRPEWLMAAAVFCLFWLVSSRYTGPACLWDEVGYLRDAAVLGGHTIDWASKWYAGYSLLLAPLFKILSGPGQVWQGVMALNAAMFAASFLMLTHLVARFFPNQSARHRIAAVAVAAIYPTWLTMSGYAFATPAMVLVFMLAVIAALLTNPQHPCSVIPHSLAVGFLCWIHPTGLAVALASVLALSAISLKRRQFVSLSIHVILVGMLILVYYQVLDQWLASVGTSPDLTIEAGYPSYSVLLSDIARPAFWIDTVVAALGQMSYLAIGSFGLAVLGFIELLRRAREHFLELVPRTRCPDKPVGFVALFALLSILGVILMGSMTFSGLGLSRPDQWIYGRYAEGVLLPFLAFGLLATWQRRWTPVLAVGLILSGVLLGLVANPFGRYDVYHTAAFWPQYLFRTPDFLLWMAMGALGVFLFQVARQEGTFWKRAALILMIAAYTLSAVSAAEFHQRWLDGFSKPSSSVEIVRANFEPGGCVGFNPEMATATSPYQRQRDELHLFYLYDYRYQRMSVSGWLDSCNGPLLTYEIGHLIDKPGVMLLGREARSGLYLVAKDREDGFEMPTESTKESTFYSAQDWTIEQDLCIHGDELATLPSDVGEFRNGAIASTGQAGLLTYGPYFAVKTGDYSFEAWGTGRMTASAWVEVVSEAGQVQHAQFGCMRTGWDESGVLAAGTVFIRGDPDDVEIRLHVGVDDVIHLEGYRLISIDPVAMISN